MFSRFRSKVAAGVAALAAALATGMYATGTSPGAMLQLIPAPPTNIIVEAPDPSNLVVAASCSIADIQTAHDALPASGGTVQIPACSETWNTTTPLTITKSVYLAGAGTSQTIITDTYSDNETVMSVTCPTDGWFRMSGLRFNNGLVTDEDGNRFLRIASCPAAMVHNVIISGYGSDDRSPWGESDNSFLLFHNITWSGAFAQFWLSHFSSFLGVGSFGDNSWAQPTDFGSAEAVYFEDSTFTHTSTGQQSIVEANGQGGRYVFRFNAVTGHYWPGGHGTESPGRPRGIRKQEVYHNIFTPSSGQDRLGHIRSGTSLYFNNTKAGSAGFNVWMQLITNRVKDSFTPWGYCDGTGPYDDNDSTTYFSGTMDAGSTTDSVTDAAFNFETGCNSGSCVRYSIRDTTIGRSSIILTASGNTATTRPSGNFGGPAPHAFAPGNLYQVRRAHTCIDQVGYGQSSVLLSGSTPTPTGFVGNALEPVYLWGNVGNPNLGYVSSSLTVAPIQNLHYYIPEPTNCAQGGGSCTAGVGSGTRAQRPSNCTAGVAWWATDGGGNWNTVNGGGADGGLDKCVSTNTWDDDWYVPLLYPHPWRTTFPPAS